MKRTKIVATIGPASEDVAMLTSMISAGLNVARLNFSHNVHEHHLMLINRIRSVAKKLGTTVSFLQDLQGPRIRIGNVGTTGIEVATGDEVILFYSTKEYKEGTQPVEIPTHYEKIHRDLKQGSIVLIDDALIQLEVVKIANKKIHCKVTMGGLIRTHKGMNFPNAKITADPLTRKDLEDVAFGVQNKVDFVAISFVKNAKEIISLRDKILALEKKYGYVAKNEKVPHTKIIAKIERIEAVDNFNEILEAVDGVMVARGDLGIELPFEQVPLIQKKIIRRCNMVGKPVIVATQMLESMIKNPLPTRAEVSDIANAILDGTDAIMLSGESAGGKYPLQSVQAMQRIAREVERLEFKMMEELDSRFKQVKHVVDFIAYTAQDVAEKMQVKAIVCFTESGYTAQMISRYKSRVPLYVFTEHPYVRNQVNLSWGTVPHTIKFVSSYKKMLESVTKILKDQQRIAVGDKILVCAGQSLNMFEKDNFIQIEKVN
jgi:pyruvate kinase